MDYSKHGSAAYVLQHLPDGLLIVNKQGKILYCNVSLSNLFGYEESELKGESIRKLIPDKSESAHMNSVTSFMSYPGYRTMGDGSATMGQRKDGTLIPVDVKLVPMQGEEQQVMAVVKDISAEQQLNKNLVFERESVRLMQKISSKANRTGSFDEMLQFTIVAVGEFMEWPIGHVYIPASSGERMITSGIWFLESPESFASFKTHTSEQAFIRGEGLIGSVWEYKQTMWLQDLTNLSHYFRSESARKCGLKRAIAVPVLAGDQNEVVAILEFYSRQSASVSPQLQELINSVSVQIAHVKEREMVRQQLKEREALFRQLFENARSGMIVMDPSAAITMVNRGFEEMFGFNTEEVKGKRLDQLIIGDGQQREHQQALQQVSRGEYVEFETTRLKKDGGVLNVLIQGVPVQVEKKQLAIFGIYIDITRQKQLEKEQLRSLREKEVMMAEIHHRVKNNLAIIQAFLQLQIDKVVSDESQRILRDTISRIYSIAIAHEQIYNSEDLSSIQLNAYLSRLVEAIQRSVKPPNKVIDLNIDIESIEVDIKRAIPIGLLVNELITNSYKHAFRNRHKGEIGISIKRTDDTMELIVRDNGEGINGKNELESSSSLGMSIVKTLARQLNAELEVKNNVGTLFKVEMEID